MTSKLFALKLLLIDRDGTLIKEPPDEQIDSFSKLEFVPGVFEYLRKLTRLNEYEFILVTNQDGLGTSSFPDDTFWPVHKFLMRALENEGVRFKEQHIDRSFAHEEKNTRKPGTGLLQHIIDNPAYDLKNSWVIGDRITDQLLAKNLGCHCFLLDNKNGWEQCYKKITERKAVRHRETKETSIKVEINLDGNGESAIRTGIYFFDHMLDQLSKHSGIDINVLAKGDLHIDEHHTVEDTAITLGECFAQALGNKAGISRYGFALPMDDCMAQVALDFGGRPWLVWDAVFTREKIGEFPTELFPHFFKSFSDAAKCNLNISCTSGNQHHMIESIFKAFARTLKQAVARDDNNHQLPTTKGTL